MLGVATGAHHACAWTTSGVFCWGHNSDGQAGVNPLTSDPVESPTPVSGLDDVIDLEAGQLHTCAVVGDSPSATQGAIHCWGDDTHGQLGNGPAEDTFTPTPVADGATDYVAVAVGRAHTCGLHADETVSCWGSDTEGRAGTARALRLYSARAVRPPP